MHWIAQEQKYIFQTYRRQPLVLTRGKGCFVWDEQGRRYLDFFAGLAVNNVGHCHPAVVRAATAQMRRLIHTSNYYYTAPQIECAATLVRRSFPGRVFFCNSGAEANECAVKLSRRWGNPEGRHELIAFENSFHGRTLATITLTGQANYQKGFSPLLPTVRYARLNDLSSVKKNLNRKTCAIFLEPVQGEGGVHFCTPAFLQGLRALCDQHRLLLIFDEVQCGLGRTGALFAWENSGVRPDVFTLAKGLGGGLPIGAAVAREEVAALLGHGDHASTFGGNPVACAAANAVLKIMDRKFLAEVRQKGVFLLQQLQRLHEKFPGRVREIRGRGLMAGLELTTPGYPVVDACRHRGLLVNCTKETVLRITPPLVISRKELTTGVKILEAALAETTQA